MGKIPQALKENLVSCPIRQSLSIAYFSGLVSGQLLNPRDKLGITEKKEIALVKKDSPIPWTHTELIQYVKEKEWNLYLTFSTHRNMLTETYREKKNAKRAIRGGDLSGGLIG